MKLRYSYLLVLPVLFACTNGYNLKTVDKGSMLHDMNSKVWVVDKQYVNNINIAPGRKRRKEILVFYLGGSFYMQNMQFLGEPGGKRGRYYLDSDENHLSMYFNEDSGSDKWELHFENITPDSILLERETKIEKERFQILLKPFPKL